MLFTAFVEKGGDCQTDPLYGLTHVPEGSSFDEVEARLCACLIFVFFLFFWFFVVFFFCPSS